MKLGGPGSSDVQVPHYQAGERGGSQEDTQPHRDAGHAAQMWGHTHEQEGQEALLSVITSYVSIKHELI